MKRFITILISFLYLIAVAGLPVTVHYCKGDMVSVSILSSHDECCCKEEVEEVHGCCSEESSEQSCSLEGTQECCSFEHFLVQYDEDNQVSKNHNIITNLEKDHIHFSSIIFFEYNDEDLNSEYRFYDLPPPDLTPLWLLHCSFTFYG